MNFRCYYILKAFYLVPVMGTAKGSSYDLAILQAIIIEKSVLEIDQKYEMTIPTSIDDMELNV